VSELDRLRRRNSMLGILAAVLIATFVALLASACAKDANRVKPVGEKSATPSSSEVVVDESLLAYLSQARSLHHEADLYEDKKDIPNAIGALERLLAKKPPKPGPEVDEVIADTHARLGELRSQLDDFDAAAKDVEQGLSFTPAISYFRGHLLEVRGLIEERRGKALAAKGDTSGASKAKEAAMKAYEEAITIQDEVIKRGTPDGGTP
jgi:tetratricopeptide (TPR) repeat protein